jgi:hypothetical protein
VQAWLEAAVAGGRAGVAVAALAAVDDLGTKAEAEALSLKEAAAWSFCKALKGQRRGSGGVRSQTQERANWGGATALPLWGRSGPRTHQTTPFCSLSTPLTLRLMSPLSSAPVCCLSAVLVAISRPPSDMLALAMGSGAGSWALDNAYIGSIFHVEERWARQVGSGA